ncbi:MAG: nucleotide sugar dehydrogenase [Planctomycetes bacterium]|nr:nucleotide sugar dehydrogenase [Planctomycetota bacterium]
MSHPLVNRLRDRQATVGVVGLGYVGLPLCAAFGHAGFRVIGFDVDPKKVEKINRGESYIDAVPSADLAELREAGKVEATCDFARAAEVQAIAICVPTPLTKNMDPDTSYIERTAESIGPHLAPDTLVVLESTTYPGTTDGLLGPILERTSGLEVGKTLFLAFSPERENPGTKWTTHAIPKVAGADDPVSRDAVQALYTGAVAEVILVSSARVAESTKLLENIYRCVNIALVNELKVCFARMDVDIFEVIDAARTKPFGFTPFWPGPGLGGHCIPIDPVYLSWKAKEFGVRTKFIELAQEVNTAMPEYVLQRCMDALNGQQKSLNGSRVLFLGVAYKKDVGDVRESPALVLWDLFDEKGAELDYYDPHVPSLGQGRHYEINRESIALTDEALASYDLVVVVTDHSSMDWARVVEHSRLVVDTRNATRDVREGAKHVFLA